MSAQQSKGATLARSDRCKTGQETISVDQAFVLWGVSASNFSSTTNITDWLAVLLSCPDCNFSRVLQQSHFWPFCYVAGIKFYRNSKISGPFSLQIYMYFFIFFYLLLSPQKFFSASSPRKGINTRKTKDNWEYRCNLNALCICLVKIKTILKTFIDIFCEWQEYYLLIS